MFFLLLQAYSWTEVPNSPIADKLPRQLKFPFNQGARIFNEQDQYGEKFGAMACFMHASLSAYELLIEAVGPSDGVGKWIQPSTCRGHMLNLYMEGTHLAALWNNIVVPAEMQEMHGFDAGPLNFPERVRHHIHNGLLKDESDFEKLRCLFENTESKYLAGAHKTIKLRDMLKALREDLDATEWLE